MALNTALNWLCKSFVATNKNHEHGCIADQCPLETIVYSAKNEVNTLVISFKINFIYN